MIIIPNLRKADYLQKILQDGSGSADFTDFTVKLFVNDIVPDGDTLLAGFTEASFPGYAAVIGANFGAPFLNADDQGEAYAGVMDWVRTAGAGSQTVYGYYCVNEAETVLLYSERNPAGGVTISTAGEHFAVALRIMLDTLVVS